MFSSHLHHVLRCPCGLLRLPTHGLDIIETSGRTPIIRDKAKPREKQKQQLEPIEEDALCVNGKKRERETCQAPSLTRDASAQETFLLKSDGLGTCYCIGKAVLPTPLLLHEAGSLDANFPSGRESLL